MCQFSKSASEQANSATDAVINVTYGVVVSNPPIQDSVPIKDAQASIVGILCVFFVLVLIWNGFEFVLSGSTSFVSRSATKQNFQKAVLGLFLVFLSSSIYFLALDLFGVVADSLKPSVAEVQSLAVALLNSFGLLFNISLSLFMIVVLIVLVIRWVLVIAGFFLFPVAVFLETVSFTRGFGESLNRLVLGNFVVQIVDIILLRTVVIIVANSSSLLPGSDSIFSFAAVLSVLVLLVVINAKFYFGAIAGTVKNAVVYRGVGSALAPKSDGFPKAYSK